MPPARTLGHAAASATGAVLGGLVHVLAIARRPSKPMHPVGSVRQARLFRRGARTPSGVAFLDSARVDDVVVRESRGIGLPQGWPDIHGLAVRVSGDDGPADLLFSTTGTGRWSRYLLTFSRTQESGAMTTLFPYESDAGPVVLAAVYVTDACVELSFSVRGGEWEPYADLVLSGREADQADLTFDAVLNPPPGLRQYDAVRRVREPSYRTARETR